MEKPPMTIAHRKTLLACVLSAGFAASAIFRTTQHPFIARRRRMRCALPPRFTPAAGANTYQSVPNWCQIPGGKVDLGSPTHGGVAVDKAGNIYFSMHGGPHGIMVYSPDGKMIRGIADKYIGIHGLMINEEKGEEFLYGAREGHADVLKLKLDGTVVWTIGIPLESGKYDDPNIHVEKPKPGEKAKPVRRYNPTGIAVAPNMHVFVVDGYGQNWVHEFDENQKYVKSFGGRGSDDGHFQTCHRHRSRYARRKAITGHLRPRKSSASAFRSRREVCGGHHQGRQSPPLRDFLPRQQRRHR